MTIDDKIKDEKLRQNINVDKTKISALSSGKIDQSDHFKGEEILPSDRRK